jgi:hypothetical protein
MGVGGSQGKAASRHPKPPAAAGTAGNVQRYTPHREPLHFKDPRCREDGVPSTHPTSRCFESLHNFTRGLQRGNVLRGCHICLAALGAAGTAPQQDSAQR